MRVLLLGSGGREHAIAVALRKNPRVSQLYAIPGNGGLAQMAVCAPTIRATDLPAVCAFAKAHQIDFAIPAADDPLAMGAVDALEAMGVPCFGPTQAAARLESSKRFAKDLMQKHAIPTARYQSFDAVDAAMAYIDEENQFPVVIKADGLALGKGVVIAQTRHEAQAALQAMLLQGKFGAAGHCVVVEEFLTGPEVSVLAFCDGQTVVPMVSSMDHKRAHDGDLGPNTGGMGTVAPNPFYNEAVAAQCQETIFVPTVRAMQAEGVPFKGCLYFGLMLTPQGPKVIEYNCRFGDPEAQVVLPLLQSDLLDVMLACHQGTLAETEVRFRSAHACCVVVASGGYPEAYQTGLPIALACTGDVQVYHAGTGVGDDGVLVTTGGRVLGLTAVAPSLQQAVAQAYAAVAQVQFEGMQFRHDIGQVALRALEGSLL